MEIRHCLDESQPDPFEFAAATPNLSDAGPLVATILAWWAFLTGPGMLGKVVTDWTTTLGQRSSDAVSAALRPRQ